MPVRLIVPAFVKLALDCRVTELAPDWITRVSLPPRLNPSTECEVLSVTVTAVSPSSITAVLPTPSAGKPSDQLALSSQLPLPLNIHVFVAAQAGWAEFDTAQISATVAMIFRAKTSKPNT